MSIGLKPNLSFHHYATTNSIAFQQTYKLCDPTDLTASPTKSYTIQLISKINRFLFQMKTTVVLGRNCRKSEPGSCLVVYRKIWYLMVFWCDFWEDVVLNVGICHCFLMLGSSVLDPLSVWISLFLLPTYSTLYYL